MKLHIYDHCPFCTKARMIFGVKGLPVHLNILSNDDVQPPTSMVGRKMVPILEKDNGSFMLESMDIVHWIDRLDGQPMVSARHNPELAQWMNQYRLLSNQLIMPRTAQIAFAEFESEAAKAYFNQSKQQIIGDFAEHLALTSHYLEQLNQALVELNKLIASERGVNGQLSEDDFHLFAYLRCLSIVKGVIYPDKVDAYRNKIATLTDISLLDEQAV